jgi:hypothetical protein
VRPAGCTATILGLKGAPEKWLDDEINPFLIFVGSDLISLSKKEPKYV